MPGQAGFGHALGHALVRRASHAGEQAPPRTRRPLEQPRIFLRLAEAQERPCSQPPEPRVRQRGAEAGRKPLRVLGRQQDIGAGAQGLSRDSALWAASGDGAHVQGIGGDQALELQSAAQQAARRG